MTIEQKKISLINWITNLDDEVVLDQLAGIKKVSLDDLPDSIVQLLKIAESEPDDILTVHTSVRDILK
jgi:hypothetical protein